VPSLAEIQHDERAGVQRMRSAGITSAARAAVQPDTLSEDERAVDAVLATSQRVMVFDMDRLEIIEEELQMDGVRAPEQMILAESHMVGDLFGLSTILGSVDNLRVEGNQLLGRIKISESEREDVKHAWSLVSGGHVRDVSIGYRSINFVDIPAGETQTVNGRTFTAGGMTLRITTEWEPKETSLVPIGADDAAKIRSKAQPMAGRDAQGDQSVENSAEDKTHDVNDEGSKSGVDAITAIASLYEGEGNA